MRRYTESNNNILLADRLEFKRVVALIAVNYEQAIDTYSANLRVGIKMLQPFNSKLISSPAVIA
jgi:hypothetical protein